MEQKPQISGQLKIIRIIHFAIMIGSIIFGVLIFFMLSSSDYAIMETDSPLVYVPILAAVVLVPIAHIMFTQKLKEAVKQDELRDKLFNFQTPQIIRLALLEAVALLAIVTCLLTNNMLNFITFIVVVGYMGILFPTSSRLAEYLQLSKEDREKLEAG